MHFEEDVMVTHGKRGFRVGGDGHPVYRDFTEFVKVRFIEQTGLIARSVAGYDYSEHKEQQSAESQCFKRNIICSLSLLKGIWESGCISS